MTNQINITGSCSSLAAPSLAAQFGLEPDFTLSPELTASLVEEEACERAYEKAQAEESLFQAKKAAVAAFQDYAELARNRKADELAVFLRQITKLYP
jgi:hypothetical protein